MKFDWGRFLGLCLVVWFASLSVGCGAPCKGPKPYHVMIELDRDKWANEFGNEEYSVDVDVLAIKAQDLKYWEVVSVDDYFDPENPQIRRDADPVSFTFTHDDQAPHSLVASLLEAKNHHVQVMASRWENAWRGAQYLVVIVNLKAKSQGNVDPRRSIATLYCNAWQDHTLHFTVKPTRVTNETVAKPQPEK